MRLFFAISLAQPVLDAVVITQTALRAIAGDKGIRWSTADQLHVTLKFLGETAEEDLDLALEAAREASSLMAPFTLAIANVSAFPHAKRPQVLWIGASVGVPELTRLAEYLDKSLGTRGFTCEKKRFRPHVTVARVKNLDGETAAGMALDIYLNNAEKADKQGVFRVEEFVLMRSDPYPSGSRYTVLEVFPLSTN